MITLWNRGRNDAPLTVSVELGDVDLPELRQIVGFP